MSEEDLAAARAVADRLKAGGGGSPAGLGDDEISAEEVEITTGADQGEPDNGNGHGERMPARPAAVPARTTRHIDLPPHLRQQLDHQLAFDHMAVDRRASVRERLQREELDTRLDADAWAGLLLSGEARLDQIPESLRNHPVYGPRFTQLDGFANATVVTTPGNVDPRQVVTEVVKTILKTGKASGGQFDADKLTEQVMSLASDRGVPFANKGEAEKFIEAALAEAKAAEKKES